jgi:hypothetical protein
MKNIKTVIYAQDSTLKDLLKNLTDEAANSDSSVEDIVDQFLALAFPLSVICLFLLLSFSGYKLITSRGDPEQLKDAREQIGSAIIGFLFIVFSVSILVLLSSLFGISID